MQQLRTELRTLKRELRDAEVAAEWEAAEARVAEEMRQRAEARQDRLEAAAWFTYDRIRRDLLGRGAAWRAGCKGRPLCGKLVLTDGRRITPGQVTCRINNSLRHAGFGDPAERARAVADIFTDVVKGLPRAA
jgi:hypothetical protein